MTNPQSQRYAVRLTLPAAGPVPPRRKYKEPQILVATLSIVLPFVPYPGLYLTMQPKKPKPKKRGHEMPLYLRVRTVEWVLAAETFECTVDEMMGSNQFEETFEVRGQPRIEKHFLDLQRMLRQCGFDIEMDVEAPRRLNKYPDGSRMEMLKPWEI